MPFHKFLGTKKTVCSSGILFKTKSCPKTMSLPLKIQYLFFAGNVLACKFCEIPIFQKVSRVYFLRNPLAGLK